MNIKAQFSKNSSNYEEYNLIQKQVIQKLLNDIWPKPPSVLDLGCGTGGVYKAIDWPLDNFVGIDFSEQMVMLHPKAAQINCRVGDFNDQHFYEQHRQNSYERIISASSLQWAKDLNATFKCIKSLNTSIAFAIFTANTFQTLFATANISPILRTVDEVTLLAKQYFDASYETVHYSLQFDNTLEMLRYIKKSGVSAARNILNYKGVKQLIRNYPLNYLEFEVVFIIE